MKKTISILILFLSLNNYSQYFEAEIHFLDGTSKKGIAQINILSDKIIYKNNETSKKEKYNHENISKLILKKDAVSYSFRYKKTLGRRAPKLLQTIIESNNLSLFALVTESNFLSSYGILGALASTMVDVNKNNYEYYIVKNNAPKAIFFGNTESTSRKRLREIIKKRLKECLKIVRKAENKEFKVTDIPRIVDLYNKNCSSKQTNFIE
jgi:hypothetical protein